MSECGHWGVFKYQNYPYCLKSFQASKIQNYKTLDLMMKTKTRLITSEKGSSWAAVRTCMAMAGSGVRSVLRIPGGDSRVLKASCFFSLLARIQKIHNR